MPDDDITHPIADLTGYITEGQIVLDRALYRRDVRPPINPLPSLSRLMDKVAGISTLPGHKAVSDQLYSLYARATEVRRMAELVGKDNLSPHERSLLDFSVEFEEKILNQQDRARSLKEGMDLSMTLFAKLSDSLLDRISPEMLAPFREAKKP
jgi:V/A-type H+-transporting ATPase subunit B